MGKESESLLNETYFQTIIFSQTKIKYVLLDINKLQNSKITSKFYQTLLNVWNWKGFSTWCWKSSKF